MSSFVLASNAHTIVPQNYVWPSAKAIPVCEGKAEIPIIDLHDEENLVHRIMKAIQEFGCFQVTNHGISIELMNDATNMFKEFHNLSQDEKQNMNNHICNFHTSSINHDKEELHYWRNCMRQYCHPLDKCAQFWPTKPTQYREIVKEYIVAMKILGAKVLENIAQGLELKQDYFENELTQNNVLYVNSYPACPDPSSTLGLAKHKDLSLLTLLHSGDVPGLLLFKDGKWLSVETPPHTYLVVGGSMLEVVSNGIIEAAVHFVRNSEEDRASEAFFIMPIKECIVEPAKSLIESQNISPLYKSFKYKEYSEAYQKDQGGRDTVLDRGFKIDQVES